MPNIDAYCPTCRRDSQGDVVSDNGRVVEVVCRRCGETSKVRS